MHMRIVSGKASKPTRVVVPTAEHKVDECLAVENVRLAEDVESGKTPVDAVHAEVGGEVVGEGVAFLVECFDEGDVQRDQELP